MYIIKLQYANYMIEMPASTLLTARIALRNAYKERDEKQLISATVYDRKNEVSIRVKPVTTNNKKAA